MLYVPRRRVYGFKGIPVEGNVSEVLCVVHGYWNCMGAGGCAPSGTVLVEMDGGVCVLGTPIQESTVLCVEWKRVGTAAVPLI